MFLLVLLPASQQEDRPRLWLETLLQQGPVCDCAPTENQSTAWSSSETEAAAASAQIRIHVWTVLRATELRFKATRQPWVSTSSRNQSFDLTDLKRTLTLICGWSSLKPRGTESDFVIIVIQLTKENLCRNTGWTTLPLHYIKCQEKAVFTEAGEDFNYDHKTQKIY